MAWLEPEEFGKVREAVRKEASSRAARETLGLGVDVAAMFMPLARVAKSGIAAKFLGKGRKSLVKPHVPMFKGTEEALEFGKRADVEDVAELMRLQRGTVAEATRLRKGKDFDAAMQKAFEGQFYREALEEWAVTHGAETVKAFGREAGGEMEGFLRELLHSPYVKEALGGGLK